MNLITRLFGKKEKTNHQTANKTSIKDGICSQKFENILELDFIDQDDNRAWEQLSDFKNIEKLYFEAQKAYDNNHNSNLFKVFISKLPPIEKYQDFDIYYLWKSKALGATGAFEQAYELLEKGVKTCKRKNLLLDNIGRLKFEQNCIEAFGWWMQSCIIGTKSWNPYLYLSYAAKVLNLEELFPRLLSAADVLSFDGAPRMMRIDVFDEQQKIVEIINTNRESLINAFKQFEKKMDKYLPSQYFLPDDERKRETAMWVDTSKIIKAQKILFARDINAQKTESSGIESTIDKDEITLDDKNSFIDERDGKNYKTVKIGSQTWMTENLNAGLYQNNMPIQEVKSADEWNRYGEQGKGCWCYSENDINNGNKYGKLYNWFAVADSQGLAPKGWHVASKEECEILVKFLGGEHKAASKMKNMGWDGMSKGTNESGFKALPGGYRHGNDGDFMDFEEAGNWWIFSKDIDTDSNGFSFSIYDSEYDEIRKTKISISKFSYKANGYSVRCIKD